jgi:hypothetical protein
MMDFEHRPEPLLPRPLFLRRMARWTAVAGVVLVGSLALGVFGYPFIEGLPWIDALLNASMILGGMGPVDPLRTSAGKLFASFYALYSGLAIIEHCRAAARSGGSSVPAQVPPRRAGSRNGREKPQTSRASLMLRGR